MGGLGSWRPPGKKNRSNSSLTPKGEVQKQDLNGEKITVDIENHAQLYAFARRYKRATNRYFENKR